MAVLVENRSTFVKVLIVFQAIYLAHLVQIFTCEVFFPHVPMLDRKTPFGLVYGPLFYFGLTAGHKTMNAKKVLLHISPFLSFSALYLVFAALLFVHPEHPFISFYIRIHTWLQLPFLLSYVVWATGYLVFSGKVVLSEHQVRFALYMLVSCLFFLVVAFFYTSGAHALDGRVIRFMIYAIMLSISIGSFLFLFHYVQSGQGSLHRKAASVKPPLPVIDKVPAENAVQVLHDHTAINEIYAKSALTEDTLSAYEKAITKAILEQQMYLDPDLSLDKLSKKIKVPKHHLSQTFSLRISDSFSQYVNRQRIDHACHLIDIDRDINFSELAAKCGFSSKTSFNRNFKLFMQCTPNNYRSTVDK